MIFFFRKPEIHLDAFTYRRDVIEYAPVVNGINTIPNWWKSLSKQSNKNFFPTPTMKTCTGMHDYYSKSIAVPLWSDLCIDINEFSEYRWQFSDNQTIAIPHEEDQYTGFSIAKTHRHLKIEAPWRFHTKHNLDWLYTHPIYGHKNIRDYVFSQGLLNFSKQSSINIQLFIDITEAKTFLIPFGTAFLLTPMSDKKIIVHRHLVSKEHFDSKRSLSSSISFINKYKLQNKLKECPYKDEIK